MKTKTAPKKKAAPKKKKSAKKKTFKQPIDPGVAIDGMLMDTMVQILHAAHENPGVIIASQMGNMRSPDGYAYQVQLSIVPEGHDHCIKPGQLFVSDEPPMKPKKMKMPLSALFGSTVGQA